MKQFITFIFILNSIICFTQTNNKLVKFFKRKTQIALASWAISRNNDERARSHYLKAYKVDTTNYKANLGLGLVLAEFMERYEEAIPYLETAYLKSPRKDTSIDVIFALAKSYQHIGKSAEALELYYKLDNSYAIEDDNQSYLLDLSKRKEDCVYALNHSQNENSNDLYIINLGSNVNTSFPEYVPTITSNNELIFTSKRKNKWYDRINKINGRYFESMYSSKLENGKPQKTNKYHFPDFVSKLPINFRNESVISISGDGKTLFVFRNTKIYEINIDSVAKTKPSRLSKKINFSFYQNHAYLTKDQKTLIFTSDSEKGNASLDIFKSVKNEDGTWGKPESLGENVNTIYDEDAPFLSDDEQTLYFASKGHPGYGNYDIYKSTLIDGKWSKPENLGESINSPGHDIFLTHNFDGTEGYFSSYRSGGYGDMDIYKIIYSKGLEKKECKDLNNPSLNIVSNILNDTLGLVSFEADLPKNLNAKYFSWTINDEKLLINDKKINQKILTNGLKNNIQLKVVFVCDTCFEAIAYCNNTELTIGKKELIVDTTKIIANTDKKGPSSAINDKQSNKELNPYDKNLNYNYISDSLAKTSLGFNVSPIYFSLNKSDIKDEATLVLNENIKTLQKNPKVAILIYGFSDATGSLAYNLDLSQKRALQVKKYLISNGVDPKQIKKATGKGSQFLVNNCHTASDCDEITHGKNRRVEFVLLETNK